MGGVQERLLRFLHGAGLRHLLRLGLALLQLADHLGEDLGVLQEIVLHDLADGLLLLVREGRILRHRGGSEAQRADESHGLAEFEKRNAHIRSFEEFFKTSPRHNHGSRQS